MSASMSAGDRDMAAIYNRAYDVEFRESGGRAGSHCIRAGIDAVEAAARHDALEEVIQLGDALMLFAPNEIIRTAVENYKEAIRRIQTETGLDTESGTL